MYFDIGLEVIFFYNYVFLFLRYFYHSAWKEASYESMVEIDGIEHLEFEWGKKQGVGKKGEGETQKEVQFYQSFTYDGMEYDLYDTVYLHNDDGPGPYIGKLIEIWENPDKTKEVVVLWFFRPYEIDLEVEGTAKNELFLASGEGVGLANVNPLVIEFWI